MALSRYKLGDLVELCEARNENLRYGINDVKGISIQKVFIETKADMTDVSLNPYYLVQPDDFAYVTVTSRNGEKITLAHNTTDKTYIVSSSYVVFRIKDKKLLLSDFLFIYFNRPEFDRYSRFNSWGSARETFTWEDMCDIDIDLPPLSIQQKYVDVYNAMLANQQSYERGLDDLKLVCDAYIENLRREMPCEPIGRYVHQCNVKNTNGEITLEQGINIEKRFITPQRLNDNFYGRKIVRTGQIAYCTQLNNENVAVALRTGPDCIVSGVYDVIELDKDRELLPEYLMLWLIRSEFGRFVYWASQGTSYEFLTYENLASYNIPIPDIEVQKSIVNIYHAYNNRREINEKLKTQLKNICPILIKGSIEEARKMEA
jgi:type I restriction enzyme S subunit